MKMDDEMLKRVLQKEADMEADRIIEEVNRDPALKDVVAPDVIEERLFKQIRKYEASKSESREAEVEELIRLGKKYKKKMSRRKYWVIAAALICVLAFGTISFGGAEKVFSELQRAVSGREQRVVNTDDGDRVQDRGQLTEEEAYEQVYEKFGFYPVRMGYLPERMSFEKVSNDETLQSARLYYKDKNEGRITYRIVTNHRTGSMGSDIEDALVQKSEKNVGGVQISIAEYFVEESKETRWKVDFTYKDAQYSMLLIGIKEKEVEKIVENLYFS